MLSVPLHLQSRKPDCEMLKFPPSEQYSITASRVAYTYICVYVYVCISFARIIRYSQISMFKFLSWFFLFLFLRCCLV